VAIIGVQFAQSLVTALTLASLTLMAGWVLVRVLRTWSASAPSSQAGHVMMQLALVQAIERASGVRRLAGVLAPAATRAPPTTPFYATWQRRCRHDQRAVFRNWPCNVVQRHS
jgi:hypothetical protein